MKKVFGYGLVLFFATLLVACGNSIQEISIQENANQLIEEIEKPAPHTGNTVFESETAPIDVIANPIESRYSQLFRNLDTKGKVYYVYTSRLNVRSEPIVADNNLVGALSLNDQLRVLLDVPNTVFVQVEILKTNAKIEPAEAYYVSRDYLSENRNDELANAPRSRYFMIQNVATEILRVYEKLCDDGRCAHKMVLEADVAVGEKTKDRDKMTVLGSFNVTRWIKFYQDVAGRYPSWYDPNYPMPPKPGAGVTAWTSKKVLPYDGAKVRGAFGWYAAHIGPDAHYQWTHGTLGWGVDKDKYILATRRFWSNLFTDPRSSGCTRSDNETIAYIRHLIEVGAPVIKVYAIEKLADESRARYNEKSLAWNYIMTKNGVRMDGEKADREQVLARGTPPSQWLEEGTYKVDVMPDAQGFKSGKSGAKAGKNGNVYALSEKEMRGVFLVDEGLLANYAHPDSLQVGGYGRHSFPAFAVANNDSPLP